MNFFLFFVLFCFSLFCSFFVCDAGALVFFSGPWTLLARDRKKKVSPKPNLKKKKTFEDFPLLSGIPGHQVLVYSTINACQHCPPRSVSPTTRSQVKVVCCKCHVRDPNQSKDVLCPVKAMGNGNTSTLSRCRPKQQEALMFV